MACYEALGRDTDWFEVERCARDAEPDPVLRVDLVRRWVARVQQLFADPVQEERLARLAAALDAHGTLDQGLVEDRLG